jgi:YtoQ family protein
MSLLLNLVKNTNNGMQPFDAGYASALNKSLIVIQNEDHQHALKEVDAAASAVASDQMQVVRILKYVLQGTLK